MLMVVPESCAMLRTSCGREFGECCFNLFSIIIPVQKADHLETAMICLWEECVLSREERNTKAVIKTKIWPSLSLSFRSLQNQFSFLIPFHPSKLLCFPHGTMCCIYSVSGCRLPDGICLDLCTRLSLFFFLMTWTA